MLEAGQEFAHFKIIRELGAGGMGAVYLAEDLKLHREVALKILLGEFFDDAERLARFEREAKTAAQISHPNIMAIYDIGVAPDPATGNELHYIVMERVKGIPLGEYFQSNNPDMGAVIRIASRISSGLSAAHKLNIAHRDIKSSNILVDDEGNPKILDFGLAKPIDPVQMEGEADSTDTVSQELTKAGKIVGTISYMSPEQARGDAIDVRTDIFSFGVLLYRMATGEFPFAGQSQVTTLAKILEGRHEPPRARNAHVPPELERIIDKCLQKDPNDRYQSAADLTVDLRNLRRQFDSGVTDSISGISGEYKIKKTWMLSGKRLIFAIAAVVVLSVVSLVVMNSFDSQSTSADTEPAAVTTPMNVVKNGLAVFSFENKTGDSTLDWLQTGLPEILMTDLAQSDAIPIISRERVLDHLRSSAGVPEDVQGRLEDARREIQQALKDGGLDRIPGVADAMKFARANSSGPSGGFTHADMLASAKSLGATRVLSGSFFKLGDRIRIDARMEDINSGQILLAEKVMGEDPFSLVDSLTSKVASSLNLSEVVAQHQSVTNVLTKSPEAYKLYREGMDLFAQQRYDEAIDKFEASSHIDPNFALAYLRLGMVNTFAGRQQEGQRYLAHARELRDNLPIRERSMVDIYTGLWLDRQFDEAFIKMKTFVSNFPDDKEGRAFYGLAAWQLEQDTVTAMAQLDSSLMIDPAFQIALTWKVMVFRQTERFDSAIVYAEKIKAYHPDSPAPYAALTAIYSQTGRIDDAIAENELAARLFPKQGDPYSRLAELYILKRRFDQSRKNLEEYRELAGDDPYRLGEYYNARANLANWDGKFQTALNFLYKALDEAEKMEDSTRIQGALGSLRLYYDRFGMQDSALYYTDLMRPFSGPFGDLNYALNVISIDPSKCAQTRSIFNKGLEDFRQRVPKGLWPLSIQVESLYVAACRADTAALIEAELGMARSQFAGQGGSNIRSAAYDMIRTGRYEEGRDSLLQFLSGPDEVTSGFNYPVILYMVGRAEEGLGNKAEAIRRYEEVLSYWKNPEIKIEEWQDTKDRLARLTS